MIDCDTNSSNLSSSPQGIRQTGQGMSEYLIITALIAIAGIGVVGFLGDSINNQLASMSQEIAGQDGAAATTQAQTAGGNAQTNAATGKTLANFSSDN